MDIDPGQVTAVAGQTLHTVAGLSPMAQIAAVIMIGLVGLVFVGKPYAALVTSRRSEEEARARAEEARLRLEEARARAEPKQDDMRAVVQALTEYALTMQHTVEHSEKMVKYVGDVAGSMGKAVELMMLIVAEMPGIPAEKAERIFKELEERRAALSAHAKAA